MSGVTLTWKETANLFPQIAASLEPKLAQIVAKAALDWQAQAQVRAPVDTGTLKNSIQAFQIGPMEWKIVVGAEYGVYQEYGTTFHAAQPFFGPAGAVVRPQFKAALQKVFNP